MNKTNKIVKLINNENIVSIQSETVFGLYAKLTKEHLKKINQIKRRDIKMPVQISAPNLDLIMPYISISKVQREVLGASLPGSRSFIVNASSKAKKIGLEKVMIRIPNPVDAPLLTEVLQATGPIWSSSANYHGYEAFSTAKQVCKFLRVLSFEDIRAKTTNTSSEIVDLTGKGVQIKKRK